MVLLETVACRLCHKRKVKCDKTRPGCRRCAQYGKPCPGYTVSQTFTFVEHGSKPRSSRPSQTSSPSSDGSGSMAGSVSDPWDKLHSRVLERSRSRTVSRSPPSSRSSWQSDMQVVQRKDSTSDVKQWASLTPLTPGPSSALSLMPTQRSGLFATLLDLLSTNDKISAFNNGDLNGFLRAYVSAPYVDAAMNALCYVAVGTAYNDRGLIMNAMCHYDNAVRAVRKQISIESDPHRFRPIITSMLMLRHCELFSTFSAEMGKVHDWRAHVDAMQKYVAGCGPEDIIHDEYDWKLLQAVRFHSLFLDMDQKRPSMFAQPKWLALTAERAQWDPQFSLYDLRVQVGGLLSRVERMVLHGARQPVWKNSTLSSLLEEAFGLRDMFAAWMEQYGRMHIAEQSVLAAEEAIVRAYPAARELFASCNTFTDETWASLCTTCWLWQLRIDCAILRLLDTFDATAVANYNRQDVARDANKLASSICRSIYWCCQPEVAQSPEVGIFHLNNVQSYFTLANSQTGQAWCDALMEVIKEKGRYVSENDPAVRFAVALSQRGFADRLHNSRWTQAEHSHRTIWEVYE